ncbi:DsbA family protein [Glaesserella parasuis]|uniref:DsbA family protein n=1 Tax=Glaesserella parasuis TaxID=738 RepID=UPI00136566B7|nr:DsbA family protein [Glaesserella parasuis]MDG6237010.1 DsbA family protein [Glaesserella parasuis]MDG6265179.1 DsbA family protein [Glaesserella parasuis]MDP0232010.1 DsbA family protein [Glaesserella parasuis]MDP0240501.1 DsbA family protein [Glaesserella parasuis]MDP0321721.1 DsbA family protein [Glaesserella parasuis]
MKIYYLFDPLCGWCYGASATLQKLNEIYPLTLTPTGLFYQSGRKMDADFACYAWSNDQRIEKLTGQPFSQAYLENVLQGQGEFNSANSLLALTAAQQIAPEKELAVLSALQTARYVDGLDNADFAVVEQVLHKLNLNLSQSVPLLSEQSTKVALEQRLQFGQQLANHCSVQGVPQLIVEKDDRLHIVPSQLLYGDGKLLVDYVDAL